MPYRPYDKRVKSYDLAVIPDVVRMKFDTRKAMMLDGQQELQRTLTEKEIAMREILDDAGITGVFRVPYLNLGRALIRAMGHNSGTALRKMASAEKAKAVTYGLDPDICDKIITAVIGAPPY